MSSYNEVRILIDAGLLDPDAPATWKRAVGARSRLRAHINQPTCFTTEVQAATGTYRELASEFSSLCFCEPFADMLTQLVPEHAEKLNDHLHWFRTVRWDRTHHDLPWAAATLASVLPPSGIAPVDALAHHECQIARTAYTDRLSDPGVEFARATRLREGEKFLASRRNQPAVHFADDLDGPPYNFTPPVDVPQAPKDASDAEVIRHHDQYRVWVFVSDSDVRSDDQPFDHIDVDQAKHIPGRIHSILTRMPIAAAAGLRVDEDQVLGYDDGYTVAEVAASLDLFPEHIPLADRMNALVAAQL